METHFFSATEEDEYLSWVTEITKGAIKQVPTAATTYDDVPTIVYYYPKDYQPPQSTIQTTPTSQTTPTRRLSSGRPEDSDATKKSLFELPGMEIYRELHVHVHIHLCNTSSLIMHT